MNSFDHSPQCDDNPNYEPTQADWDEYNAHLDNLCRNAWQDSVDDLQQGEDDQLEFIEELVRKV